MTDTGDAGTASGTESDTERLPQSEFPDRPLVHVVDSDIDGTERCLLFPADTTPSNIKTNWLAVNTDVAVSLDDYR